MKTVKIDILSSSIDIPLFRRWYLDFYDQYVRENQQLEPNFNEKFWQSIGDSIGGTVSHGVTAIGNLTTFIEMSEEDYILFLLSLS